MQQSLSSKKHTVIHATKHQAVKLRKRHTNNRKSVKKSPHHKITVAVAHPTAPRAATLTVVQPSSAGGVGAQAQVTLSGVNDTDGTPGALELTHKWGTSLLSAALQPGSTEYVVQGGTIVATYAVAAATLPAVGQTALSLSAGLAAKIPWLGVGDTLSWTGSAGAAGTPNQEIGGNAVLVREGTIDPGCSLAGDTTRRPRVAVGDTDNGRTLVLAVADGDNNTMPGFTTPEWGAALAAVGVDDALNLDGGQSSTLLEKNGKNLAAVNVNSNATERPVVDGLAVVPG